MLESNFLPLAADIVVAVLLIATLIYVGRLNSRLTALRADRGALADMIRGLQQASKQAEDAVTGLRMSANETGRQLDTIVSRGGPLKDDLTFLIDRAEKMADRLEAAIRGREEPASRKPSEDEPARTPNKRLTSLLRQTAQAERSEPVLRIAEPQGDDAQPRTTPRQSRSERELQRALLGRH